jgi:hypothetical protein
MDDAQDTNAVGLDAEHQAILGDECLPPIGIL